MLLGLFHCHQHREVARHGGRLGRYRFRSCVVGGRQHCGSAHVKVEDKFDVIVERCQIIRPGLVACQIEKDVDDDRLVVSLEAAAPILISQGLCYKMIIY